MSAKKKQEIEFQYYEIPHGERLLAVSGKELEQVHGKQHFHNLMEIGYCAVGSGEIIFHGMKVPYKTGMVTVIPQNIPHFLSGFMDKNRWDYLFLNPEELLREFYPDNSMFAKRILDLVNLKEQYFAAGEHNSLAALVCMIIEEYKNRGNYSGEYVRGLLLSILITVARGGMEVFGTVEDYRKQSGIGQIAGALEYIDKNYMENIKTGLLAAACNLSETHFRRLFAEYMNMTPSSYINLVRIQRACGLMQKTRYSMEEIAERVGYPAVSTFNRNFRKIIGTSPYQFKKSSENYQK